jgi:hypothetical protein
VPGLACGLSRDHRNVANPIAPVVAVLAIAFVAFHSPNLPLSAAEALVSWSRTVPVEPGDLPSGGGIGYDF